ncbi:MAG: hypothetical protein FWH26_04130 [Oscillospiraceae bacterium]|nr:hypothetical protein [Oscillospiraceae bacterium]
MKQEKPKPPPAPVKPVQPKEPAKPVPPPAPVQPAKPKEVSASQQKIKNQIAEYDKEIDDVKQYLEYISESLYQNDQERSELGGPYREQMAESIDSRERQLRAERNQAASRLPQLNFERNRLMALLD